MGAQEVTTYTFTWHAQYIYKEMDNFYREQEIEKECVEKSYEEKGKVRDEDEKLNIAVSFDGTWLTRGHKSLIGAAFVMDIYSGMVIDFEVLSNFCRACVMGKKKEKATFDEWFNTVHQESAKLTSKGYQGLWRLKGQSECGKEARGKDIDMSHSLVMETSSYKAVCNMNNGNGPYASHASTTYKSEWVHD